MDIIIDAPLSKRFNGSIRVLRYKDNYRVFANTAEDADNAVLVISESLHEYGLTLNSSKSHRSNDIISDSLKDGKVESMSIGDNFPNMYQWLLTIHRFVTQHPTSGSIIRLLENVYHRALTSYLELILDPCLYCSILVDILTLSPKSIPSICSILSIIIFHVTDV